MAPISLFLALLLSQIPLNQQPAMAGQWGYRPGEGATSPITPPAFSWRPQKDIQAWEIQVGRDKKFLQITYTAKKLPWSVHCPHRTFEPGTYWWRYRGKNKKGIQTTWSKERSFVIPKGAVKLALPKKKELLSRIPRHHPRLFLRPESVDRLRKRAKGRKEFQALLVRAEKLYRNPPPTKEPAKYILSQIRGSDSWRKTWWGNRTYTIRALNGAATLAFTHLMGGDKKYGILAKKIFLACARWDPKGATGYRYNDEAGMPYAYHFARSYTFINHLLTKEEKRLCLQVMTIRGREMYRHLCPRHFWRPYGSHWNRAWHFLGEVGIAFFDEIPDAADWVWFAVNVFYNVYPVWSDNDGGWHEGSNYWQSYIGRFTWWADVMKAALKLDAFQKPYFSQAGYYPLYLVPPGKVGGGFGDHCARRTSRNYIPIMTTLAGQTGNPHWQWYVKSQGGPRVDTSYIGFLRSAQPAVKPAVPDKLPSSRLFAGTGQAVLNSTLLDARKSVQVVFKSSPFGTQSHGYESNNSFLLWGYGQRLLIRSGYRDSYGSIHHRNWMWSTRSTNCITVDGLGQVPHSAGSKGKIIRFETSDQLDLVVGETRGTYLRLNGSKTESLVKYFTRAIVFVKPHMVLVYDRLEATRPVTYTYWLHTQRRMDINGQNNILIHIRKARCRANLLLPKGLLLDQTNQYDPNPRPRIKLREWHLTAKTVKKSHEIQFLTLLHPHPAGAEIPMKYNLQEIKGGYALRVRMPKKEAIFLLPTQKGIELQGFGVKSAGEITAKCRKFNIL